jgi:hypothetical protein
MINLLPPLVVLGTSVLVLLDSRTIGIAKGQVNGFFNMGPTGWFFSCLLCWIVAFPAYLVVRRAHKRATTTGRPIGSNQGMDLTAQLGALADLYSQGLLTEEEFQAQKKQLVHRMLEQ